MKRISAVALAILVTFGVASCGWEGTGQVIEKEYEEGETEKYTCNKTVNGKSKSVHNGCSRWDDEDWELTVRDSEGKEHEVEVEEAVFNGVNVGDTFDNRKKDS